MIKKITISQGWLSHARRVPSPNCNARPNDSDISLLVIHNISLPPEQFGGNYIEQFFTNTLCINDHPYFKTIAHIEVSAHLLITRTGEFVQFVGFDQRAWHAGVSSFDGRENCNDFSIGIELEGTDNLAYTHEQYVALCEVTQLLLSTYPAIVPERIVGHCDIAPGRKTDPGEAFDWTYFMTQLDGLYDR